LFPSLHLSHAPLSPFRRQRTLAYGLSFLTPPVVFLFAPLGVSCTGFLFHWIFSPHVFPVPNPFPPKCSFLTFVGPVFPPCENRVLHIFQASPSSLVRWVRATFFTLEAHFLRETVLNPLGSRLVPAAGPFKRGVFRLLQTCLKTLP